MKPQSIGIAILLLAILLLPVGSLVGLPSEIPPLETNTGLWFYLLRLLAILGGLSSIFGIFKGIFWIKEYFVKREEKEIAPTIDIKYIGIEKIMNKNNRYILKFNFTNMESESVEICGIKGILQFTPGDMGIVIHHLVHDNLSSVYILGESSQVVTLPIFILTPGFSDEKADEATSFLQRRYLQNAHSVIEFYTKKKGKEFPGTKKTVICNKG